MTIKPYTCIHCGKSTQNCALIRFVYDQEIYENAKIRLDARRQQAIRENEERRKAFIAMNPEYGELDRKIAQTSIQLTRVMLSGHKDITEAVAEIRDNNLAMQARQREILHQVI